MKFLFFTIVFFSSVGSVNAHEDFSDWHELDLIKFTPHWRCDRVKNSGFDFDTDSGEIKVEAYCETSDYRNEAQEQDGHRWRITFEVKDMYMDYSNPKKFKVFARTPSGDVLCAKIKKPHKWSSVWKYTRKCRTVVSREKTRVKKTKTGRKYKERYRKIYVMVKE